MLTVSCSRCNRTFYTPDDWSGKSVRCPSCFEPTTVPVPEGRRPVPWQPSPFVLVAVVASVFVLALLVGGRPAAGRRAPGEAPSVTNTSRSDLLVPGGTFHEPLPGPPAPVSTKEKPPTTETKPPVRPASSEEPVVVEVTELVEAYFRNELAADQKYRGKSVKITSVPEVIGRDADGRPYVGMYRIQRINPLEMHPPALRCYLSPSGEAQVANLKPGQPVAFQGVCKGKKKDGLNRGIPGYDFVVVVEDCDVLP